MRQAGRFRGEFSAADNESGQLLVVTFPTKGQHCPCQDVVTGQEHWIFSQRLIIAIYS